MTYLVEASARALHDLDLLYSEKHVSESSAAARWFNRSESAVLGLSTLPNRCPPAAEVHFSTRDLRQLLYGRKPHVYRIIYEIDERRKTVLILHIRHGAQEPADQRSLD